MYKNVPYAQAIERTERQPIGINWNDVKKDDGCHRSRLAAKEFNNGVDQTPPSGAKKLFCKECAGRRQQFNHDTCERTQSVLLRSGQAEHIRGAGSGPTGGRQGVRVLGQGDDRNEAGGPAWQEEVEKADRQVNVNPGAFHRWTWTGRDSFTVATSSI